jgi:hypothetical protein
MNRIIIFLYLLLFLFLFVVKRIYFFLWFCHNDYWDIICSNFLSNIQTVIFYLSSSVEHSLIVRYLKSSFIMLILLYLKYGIQ